MKKKFSIKEYVKTIDKSVIKKLRRSMAIARNIQLILDKKGKNRKWLADSLNKSESEISKWLRGTHNFTFSTVEKIEDVLGENLIFTYDEIPSNNIKVYHVVAANNSDGTPTLVSHTDNYISIKDMEIYKITMSADSNEKVSLKEACFHN